jgi:hypothetical protein
MDIGSTDTIKIANLPSGNPGPASPQQVKEFDSERARSVADAEATIARMDQEPADAENDDQPVTKAAKPENSSRFTPGGFTDTEPCASDIEPMHRDRDAGMSDAEALNRGMARMTVFAETLFLPTPGPGGTPPLNVPATDPSATADDAAPDPIDDAATGPVPQKPLEQVGEYQIEGTKSFNPDTKTFSREIEGLYGNRGGITDTRPVCDLLNRFRAEAKQAGAHELHITGKIVHHKHIMQMKMVFEQVLGGKVEKIDDQTIVFTVSIL